MALTYIKIASATVGSGGASSIDFNSIVSTYDDLVILASIRTTNGTPNTDMAMRFNGSTSGYSNRQLYGTGSQALSNAPFSDRIYIGSGNGNGATSNTFGNQLIYIPNYKTSNNKSVSTDAVSENNGTTAFMNLVAGLWSNSAAITSISLFDGNTIMQHSTAVLYGISRT